MTIVVNVGNEWTGFACRQCVDQLMDMANNVSVSVKAILLPLIAIDDIILSMHPLTMNTLGAVAIIEGCKDFGNHEKLFSILKMLSATVRQPLAKRLHILHVYFSVYCRQKLLHGSR